MITHTQEFIETRGPFQNYRRTALERLIKQHKLDVPENSPATVMRSALVAAGVSPEQPKPPEKEEEIDLESLNPFQLRTICKQRGVRWQKTDTKEDLLRKLRA